MYINHFDIFLSSRSFHSHFPRELLCSVNRLTVFAQRKPRCWVCGADVRGGEPHRHAAGFLSVGAPVHVQQRCVVGLFPVAKTPNLRSTFLTSFKYTVQPCSLENNVTTEVRFLIRSCTLWLVVNSLFFGGNSMLYSDIKYREI